MLSPVHPFATTWHFPSRGNEKIGGTGYCVTYDTDSQSRNAPCVPFRGRGPRSGEGMYEGKNDYDTRCGRDRRRRHYKTHRPLKGKRLTTFCASLALLHPLLSLTHWIFGSLMLPYKSGSHSAKCVRCASLRSGGRRLAVRKMIECHIFAQPRTPFCHYVAFPLKGKRENRWHWILCHI